LLDSFVGNKAFAVLSEWDYGQTKGQIKLILSISTLLQLPGEGRCPRRRGEAGEGFSHGNEVITQKDGPQCNHPSW